MVVFADGKYYLERVLWKHLYKLQCYNKLQKKKNSKNNLFELK